MQVRVLIYKLCFEFVHHFKKYNLVRKVSSTFSKINCQTNCNEQVKCYWNKILFSINTQVIIQNRALSLARYLGLSADNHLDGQNGCQWSFCHCK